MLGSVNIAAANRIDPSSSSRQVKIGPEPSKKVMRPSHRATARCSLTISALPGSNGMRY